MANGNISFGAILKKMHMESRSGQLHIDCPDGQVVMHLREGKIVGVDMPAGESWVIGEYLVGTGSISERRLLRCLRIADKQNVPPEKVAVEKGYVSKDVALRFVELHAKETILPLFTKVGIMVRFQNVAPRSNPLLPPISIPFLIKEGSKRAAEWPALLKRIPTFDMVYAQDQSFLATLRRTDGDAMDPFKANDRDRAMGANERIVYFFVNGKRSIRLLTRVAGLDLYSTCMALYNLESRFMIKGTGAVASGGAAMGTIFPFLMRVVTFAGIVATLVALGLYLPGPLQFLAGEGSLDLSQVETVQPVRFEYTVRATIEDVWLLTLELPKDLAALPGFTQADLDAAGLHYLPLQDGRYLLTRGELPRLPDAVPPPQEEGPE